MAQSLETLRSSKVVSIYGRRLGIDKDDYLVGAPGLKEPIEDLTTSTGTDVKPYGIARVTATGSSQGPVQYNLGAPVPGITKTLLLDTTSTGSYQFLSTPNGASILSGSDGTTKSLINLLGQGGSVILKGLTTAKWAMVGAGNISTGTLNVSFTTST